MTEEEKKTLAALFEAMGSKGAQFQIGQVIGSQVNTYNYYGQNGWATEAAHELNRERLASAIEACQTFFWGATAYAVVFCLLRDEYGIENNQSAFERMVEELPYTGKRDYVCGKGTLANAFKNNPIYSKPVGRWRELNANGRVLTLLEELRKRMDLLK